MRKALTHRGIIMIVLLGIVSLGTYLRLRHLGALSLWTDELFSVFAAQDVGHAALPHLPSGRPYSRALIFTCAVAAFGRLFGFGHVPVRLPGVLFGVVLIPVAYALVARLFGRRAGLVCSFLVAACPFFVLWAQQCRMYTLFMLVYLILVFRVFSLLQQVTAGRRVGPVAWGSAILLFGLSFSLHELTLLLVPAIAAYCIIDAVIMIYARGWRTTLRSPCGRIAIGVVAASCCVVLFKYRDIGLYLRQMPSWRGQGYTTLAYYRSIIHETYPLYAYLYPVSLIALIARRGRAGLYMACAFIVPFLALSACSWRGYKYLLFVFPFFLIPLGVLFADAAGFLWSAVRARVERLLPRLAAGRRMFLSSCLGCVIALGLGYPALFPWIKVPPERFATFGRYDFSPYAALIKGIGRDDVLICTEPFLIEYYTGRKPDYMILTRWHSDAMGTYDFSYANGQGQTVDMNAGIPLIGLDGLKELEAGRGRVWIVSNTWFLNSNPHDAEVLDYITATYTKHPASARTFAVYTLGE